MLAILSEAKFTQNDRLPEAVELC